MAVVIVGASQGLGECLCESFYAHGKNVVGASRNTGRLQALQAKCPNLSTVIADVRSAQDMKRTMEHANDLFGGISTLILSFGVNFDELVVDWESPEAFRTVVETNLIGAANALHAALPYLQRNDTSQIVVLTSLAGVVRFFGYVFFFSKIAIFE
jgi:NADP-dependent 3-hydroxy acid dehydrogenase YdfG